jgi:RND family efflux transporter MFP subunit
MSAPLEGVLMEVLVEEGEVVERGQILAVMDNRIAKAAVSVAQGAADHTAAIDHAKHELTLAESLLARLTALQEAEAGAEFELEQAKARRDQAEAALRSAAEQQLQAKWHLELEKARLEAHNIRAPFSGRILSIEVVAGTTLTQSDDLLTIVCLDHLEAQLHLPLELFGKLRTGESYRLLASAPVGRSIQSRLVFAAPVIEPATKTYRCVFTIDNKDRRLPAGFAVRFEEAAPEPLAQDPLAQDPLAQDLGSRVRKNLP